jgi:hypothetical protein
MNSTSLARSAIALLVSGETIGREKADKAFSYIDSIKVLIMI